jgi:hypothetical protein
MTVPPAPTPPSWRPVAPPRPSRWPTFTFLVIALAAIALAIGSWFRPLPSTKASAPPAPIYTDQQVASAKAIVCAAFEKSTMRWRSQTPKVRTAPIGARSSPPPPSADKFSTSAAGTSSVKVAEEPATPSELASSVPQQANAFQELPVGYINGATPGDLSLQPAQKASDEAAGTIRRLCQ